MATYLLDILRISTYRARKTELDLYFPACKISGWAILHG